MGTRRRSRRSRQVTCREALGTWMAGSESDGRRVGGAAAYVKSGREEVESRVPHRGIEPRCLAEAEASDHTVGSKYEWHPHIAGHSRRQREEVARSPLCSLRRPPPGNGRWIGPAKGISKRHASAGTRGDADLDRQRAPDHAPRGSRSTSGNRRAETVGQGAAGAARTSRDIAPHHTRSTRTSKFRSAEPI